MADSRLDLLARKLGTGARTRRGFVGLVALLLGGERVAAQDTTSCAGDGQMCALGMPCCSGFVCQSSFINPTFGSCVTGDSTNGTGFSYPDVTPPTTTSTDKGPGGRRHRISERKRDRDRQHRKRRARRRNQQNNNKSKNNNSGNNNNNGNAQGFEDDYMVSATVDCTGTGSTDAATIRNTGSQTLSIAKVTGKRSGLTMFNPVTAFALNSGQSKVFFDSAAASASTDFFLSTATDEYAIITAFRGDGLTSNLSDPLVFRAFCNGKKSKRIK